MIRLFLGLYVLLLDCIKWELSDRKIGSGDKVWKYYCLWGAYCSPHRFLRFSLQFAQQQVWMQGKLGVQS